jgi:hypothetical protein
MPFPSIENMEKRKTTSSNVTKPVTEKMAQTSKNSCLNPRALIF